jgi:hypothetical protein
MKQVLELEIRPVVKLSEIERLIRRHRIMTPVPSRQTLIRMCESGIFETVRESPGRSGWLVYEDSFIRWVKDLNASRE